MNQQELSRIKTFNRRALVVGGSQLAVMTVLAGRLYYLQAVESERYRMLAEENRVNLRLLAPPRGRVFDRFGQMLAQNRHNYRVVLVPEQTDDIDVTLAALGQIIPVSEEDRARVLREAKRRRGFVPVMIRQHLTWRQVSQIEINGPDLPGVAIEVGQLRHYPNGAAIAHVIGYVAAASEDDLTGDPLLELPDFRIGKNGIEKVHDQALRGAAGRLHVEVNAHGRVIRELDRHEGARGQDVTLTLDLALQGFVNRRLGDESAAAVLLDVHSGETLALAATPGFDPNAFNRGLSQENWRRLVDNPRSPLINKTIAGRYPPGSTFKPVVALAALEAGVMGPDHTVFCPGHMTLGNRRFHCWKRGGHGELKMVEALAHSCDVYFYDVALKTGIDRIAAMAARLGLGPATGFDLPGERAGLVPTRAWKEATIGERWQKGETLVVGIGQGYMLSTPLQLAAMTARIANGGYEVLPHITRRIGDGFTRPLTAQMVPIGLSDAALDVVRRGMERVVNHPRGTAFRSRIEEEGFAMAGKTGTSQVRRISRAERESGVIKNEDRPWKERDHALFIGYAPVHQPRYAVAVVVEHGGGGSRAAAPIARDILREAQRRDPIGALSGGRVSDRTPPAKDKG